MWKISNVEMICKNVELDCLKQHKEHRYNGKKFHSHTVLSKQT